MNLTEQDAYALRRALSMMDVPTELNVSPLVESLLATLDWKNNPAHWSLLQQIVTHDPDDQRPNFARRSDELHELQTMKTKMKRLCPP